MGNIDILSKMKIIKYVLMYIDVNIYNQIYLLFLNRGTWDLVLE